MSRIGVAISFLALLSAPATAADLTIHVDNPILGLETLTGAECEVQEGCVLAGERTVIRFDTITPNEGTGLPLGPPAPQPEMFHYDDCHEHYHFTDYIAYSVLDDQSSLVLGPILRGGCIRDSNVDPNAQDPAPNAQFTCGFQGLSPGWQSEFPKTLDCQVIDLSGLPEGAYTLVADVDPMDLIAESDETNNSFSLPFVISTATGAPDPEAATWGWVKVRYR